METPYIEHTWVELREEAHERRFQARMQRQARQNFPLAQL